MTTERNVECLVLGLGGMGSAALYHLSRMGRRSLGIEQFSIGHDRGSSHGRSRAFRTLYADPLYTQLAAAALPLWRELEEISRAEVLELCGQLLFARSPNAELERRMAALDTTELTYERLTGAETVARFPALSLPKDATVCFTPQAGFIDPSQAIRAHVESALQRGAAVEESTEVLEMDLGQERPLIHTTRGRIRAEQVVIASGPWTPKVLASLKLPLRVTRQEWFTFRPETAAGCSPQELPVYADFDRDFYGFPLHDGVLKAANGEYGASTSPQTIDRSPKQPEKEALESWLREILPGRGFVCTAGATCMYTVAPRDDFLLGPHPHHPGVFVAAGFSGHGFKFATLVGRILAELVTQGRTTYPIEAFRLERFV